MRSKNALLVVLVAMAAALAGGSAFADNSISEDFTGATTNNPWYFFNGACLTASSTAASTSPGTPPGCTADSYYTEHLVGGYNGASGTAVTLPDPAGYGALRFTNGCIPDSSGGCSNGGHSQNGAILSSNTYPTDQGLDITFKTLTYRGDSGGANNDGADGMSFFLMDGSNDITTNPQDDIGSWGGSLGYTCSNTNPDYHGMVGAYLGLGIDEYGNFLNGVSNSLGESGSTSTGGDNTASGGLYKPNRIGLRGAGNIAFPWLSANYSSLYPSSLTASQQQAAVQNTCRTGTLWNYSTPASPTNTGTAVMDYPAINNAYTVISKQIAKEYSAGGYSSRNATPITYRLKITQNGLLTLDYSYNGGAWSNVITNQDITQQNGALPANIRFGFAGSTGGSSNIHEILCFKATPADASASSTTGNQRESSKLQNGSQLFFAYYDPTTWTGTVTANQILVNSSGAVSIASTATWDASCNLTGVASSSTCATTGVAGPVTAQSPTGRTVLTWSGTAGIPFEWTNLSSAEQTALNAGDSNGQKRLAYLRGDRSNEYQTNGTGLFRIRSSVLADLVDSSPQWVGPPSQSLDKKYLFPTTWSDFLYPSATMPENSGQTYAQYYKAEATRPNVVYVGANDGMLHGFSAGSYNADGTYNSSGNTGQEVLAYVPQAVLLAIHNSTTAKVDYSNVQYGHAFYVDAPPNEGDIYYSGAWHTWLVGGLGPGGKEIYALDVTNPSSFAESNSASLVVGDWTSSTISCTNVSSCGNNLGQTYGTPTIVRLHNGTWGIIFGNGIKSTSGDAGIFILTVDPTSGAQTMYYLSTHVASSNGIAYAYPADLDGDNVADYVYAGDLHGNVWRFDLTSNSAGSWAVSPGPIFTTPSGQPITSRVQPAAVMTGTNGPTEVMLYFGSGEKFPITNSAPQSYQSGTQSFYGIWDWNLSAWNALNSAQYASMTAAAVGTLTSLASPYTLSTSNLVRQTLSTDASGDRSESVTNPVCWAGSSTCTPATSNTKFGWYFNFPGTNTAFSTTTYEQSIYNPEIQSTAVIFNSVLPAVDSPLSCSTDLDQGFTYKVSALNGGPTGQFCTASGACNSQWVGIPTNGTGTPYYVDGNLISPTTNGGNVVTPITLPNDIVGSRLTWTELR
jgi:type IV pilus assembly protein PilY1